MIMYKDTEYIVRSPDGDTKFFNVVAGVLQGDTWATYPFITCLDYVLQVTINSQRALDSFKIGIKSRNTLQGLSKGLQLSS